MDNKKMLYSYTGKSKYLLESIRLSIEALSPAPSANRG